MRLGFHVNSKTTSIFEAWTAVLRNGKPGNTALCITANLAADIFSWGRLRPKELRRALNLVRFSPDSVAKLSLRRRANRDSVDGGGDSRERSMNRRVQASMLTRDPNRKAASAKPH